MCINSFLQCSEHNFPISFHHARTRLPCLKLISETPSAWTTKQSTYTCTIFTTTYPTLNNSDRVPPWPGKNPPNQLSLKSCLPVRRGRRASSAQHLFDWWAASAWRTACRTRTEGSGSQSSSRSCCTQSPAINALQSLIPSGPTGYYTTTFERISELYQY